MLALDPDRLLPVSRLITWAISSARSTSSPEIRLSNAARSKPGMAAITGAAFRAAVSAASRSASVERGWRETTSPRKGSRTSSCAAASRHAPPMSMGSVRTCGVSAIGLSSSARRARVVSAPQPPAAGGSSRASR